MPYFREGLRRRRKRWRE